LIFGVGFSHTGAWHMGARKASLGLRYTEEWSVHTVATWTSGFRVAGRHWTGHTHGYRSGLTVIFGSLLFDRNLAARRFLFVYRRIPNSAGRFLFAISPQRMRLSLDKTPRSSHGSSPLTFLSCGGRFHPNAQRGHESAVVEASSAKLGASSSDEACYWPGPFGGDRHDDDGKRSWFPHSALKRPNIRRTFLPACISTIGRLHKRQTGRMGRGGHIFYKTNATRVVAAAVSRDVISRCDMFPRSVRSTFSPPVWTTV
jgi:hypothetical protein